MTFRSMLYLTVGVGGFVSMEACGPVPTAPTHRVPAAKSHTLVCHSGYQVSMGRDGQPIDSTYTGCLPGPT